MIEKLLQRFPSNRIMYGSQYPLYTLKSTLLLVEQAEIDDEAKQRIMGMNASREFSCPRTFRTTKGAGDGTGCALNRLRPSSRALRTHINMSLGIGFSSFV